MKFGPISDSNAMSATDFTANRQAIARTFGLLQGVVLPTSVPDDIARLAIHAYLGRRLVLARAAVNVSTAGASPPAPAISVNMGSSGVNPSVSVSVGSSANASCAPAGASSLSTPATATSPALSKLHRSFNSLLDHLQQAGVNVGDTDSLGTDESLPAYMKKSMVSQDTATSQVPDTISDAMAAADKKFLDKLNFIYSERNLSGTTIFEDVEREMQDRFAADDMQILNAEKRGTNKQRARVRRIKTQAHHDFRRLLEVRQQRYKLQRFAQGNALMKAEIEELKSSEFMLFSQIRIRFRSLNVNEMDRKRALAALTSAADATYARAVFQITPAQAKTYLTSLHKSAFKPKRPRDPPKVPANGGWRDQRPPPKRAGVRACYHCGASGDKYHNVSRCPDWLAGKPPKKGTEHAKKLAAGKTIPRPKKSSRA